MKVFQFGQVRDLSELEVYAAKDETAYLLGRKRDYRPFFLGTPRPIWAELVAIDAVGMQVTEDFCLRGVEVIPYSEREYINGPAAQFIFENWGYTIEDAIRQTDPATAVAGQI